MRNNGSQQGGVILGVFLFLLALVCIAYFTLVAFVNAFEQEPQPGKAILAALLAILALVGAVASLRFAGITGRARRIKTTNSDV